MSDREPPDGRFRQGRLVAAGAAGALVAVLAIAVGLKAQERPVGGNVLPPAAVVWTDVARDYKPDIAPRYENNKGFLSNPKEWETTPIPVLMPSPGGPVSAGQLIFYSFPDGYDINMPQGVPGLKVLLSGNRVYVQAEPGTLSRTKYDRVVIDGTGAVQSVIFSDTEDGWLASFSRYGISYTAEVTCETAEAEPYCADPAYIRKVAASLNTVILPPQAKRDYAAATRSATPFNRNVLKAASVPTDPNLIPK